MAQPVSYSPFTYIGTVGSVALTNNPTNVIRAIIPGSYVGTVMLYDSATAAGTSATNVIGTIGLPATASPMTLAFGIRTRYGLVYTATGTPNMTLVWGD